MRPFEEFRIICYMFCLFLLTVTVVDAAQDDSALMQLVDKISHSSRTVHSQNSKDKALFKEIDEGEEGKGCHEMALRKCGSSMVRVFRLLEFLPPRESFEAKCSLRTAFFTCMQKEEMRPCKKHHLRSNDIKFRERLVNNLWSTRGCVLGLLADGTHV